MRFGRKSNKVTALLTGAMILTAQAGLTFETLDFSLTTENDDLRDALRASSLVLQAKADGLDDPAEILASARSDYARLVGVLYSQGYFGGSISIAIDGVEAAEIQPLNAPETIESIQVTVDPGPLYTFGVTEVEPLATDTLLPEGFAPGEVAETGVIQDAADAARLAWRQQGHAKASIEDQQITARHDDQAIDVRLGVNPGPRLTFGDLTVAGNEDVTTRRILKITGLERGRVYHPDDVNNAARRLRDSGAFTSVVINEAQEPTSDGALPLEIAVVEQTPRRFGLGAEVSTLEGLRLSGFWLHRNWLGGAERLRVEGELDGIGGQSGGTDLTFSVRYERPASPRPDTNLFVLGEVEFLDEPEFQSDGLSFTIGFERRATEELDVSIGLGYVFSDVVDDFGQETYQYFTLPLGATYDRRDDPLDAKSGFFVDLGLTPFVGITGTSFGAQFEADARYYRTIANDRLTLAGRLQLGALGGPSLLETPPLFRFFSGGGGTVRGQDFQSLGVTIGANETGGRSFVGLTGETRYNVRENIQAVAFYDWGYIGEEVFFDGTGESHAGVGIGARYLTGIGPIRVDLAFPVRGTTEASDFSLLIGIGQAF